MKEQKKPAKAPRPLAVAKLPEETKKETFSLPVSLLAEIEAYRDFQCHVAQSDKVTKDLAIQVALEAFFEMDKAFQHWKKNRSSLS